MNTEKFKVCGLPAILWGDSSQDIFLYIHGQGGCKEEAEILAGIACQYYCQVLSIDLPEHGERIDEKNTFDPWHVLPELCSVMEYIKTHWQQISLCANSIGAWFSMLAFQKEPFVKCLFISPIVDMAHLISNMMIWADVTDEQLKKEHTISTAFGQTLSWEYLMFARKYSITIWNVKTEILYGEKDHLTELSVIESFCKQFQCNIQMMKDGEHWFHTPEQLDVLSLWLQNRVAPSIEKSNSSR